MRSSDAAGRIALANYALVSVGAKGHLGPNIGGGANNIGAAAARAAGIIVDDNGRLRCPAGGPTAEEFTDMQMSNCIISTPRSVGVGIVRGLASIPSKMRQIRKLNPRYKPHRIVGSPQGRHPGGGDRDAAHQHYADRLDDGMPLEGVPDEFLWGAIVFSHRGENDRFDIQQLSDDPITNTDGNDLQSGINETALVTDSATGKQMFVKRENNASEGPHIEMMSHIVASSLGLPVGEFRFANDGQNWSDLVVMQDHVKEHISTSVIQPAEIVGPGEHLSTARYDPEGTFGANVPHNVDNLATITSMDWVLANGDRHGQNMMVTKHNDGEVHVVPIDHGWNLYAGNDRPVDRQSYLAWMAHDDIGGVYNPGLGFVLADQETHGFATRKEILDALEGSRERLLNLNMDDINETVLDSLPEGYTHQDGARAADMAKRRIAVMGEVTREDFERMLDKMQSGEATRTGPQQIDRNVEMYAPGVVVPHDVTVLDMEEDVHGIRQPNGVLVRGVPLRHDDDTIPEQLFHVGGLDPDAKGAGVANPDSEGIYVGFVGLHEDEESANQRLDDMRLYQTLSQAWEADEFDDAYDALVASVKDHEDWEVMPRDTVIDFWNNDDPLGMLSIHFRDREFFAELEPPRLSNSRADFESAASAEPPAIMKVSKSKLNSRTMMTETESGIRFYGDVPYTSARRTKIKPAAADTTPLSTASAVTSNPVRRELSIATPADLDPIHDLFKNDDKKLLLVGGAVRDTMLGKDPKDFDLATDATPDEVIAMLSTNPDLKIDLTGEDFAVVRVKTPGGNEYEIATFRTDVGEGRRPDGGVALATIEEDVARRDLTMNALFYDLDSREVLDYVGGMEDIDSGVVRSVGDPADRFREDKLRILRAVRFSGRTGFDLDDKTKEAILADNDLTGVSSERVHDEFLAGLRTARDPEAFLELIDEMNLWPQVFQAPDGVDSLTIDTDKAVNSSTPSVQIAAILSQNDVADVGSVLQNMKYTNAEVADVKFLMNMQHISPDTAPRLKKELSNRGISEADLRAYAISTDIPDEDIDAFVAFTKAPQAISSQELIARGFEGPALGKAIAAAESASFASFKKNPARSGLGARDMSIGEEREFTTPDGRELIIRVEDMRVTDGLGEIFTFSPQDGDAQPSIVARDAEGTIVGRASFSEGNVAQHLNPTNDGVPITNIGHISVTEGNERQGIAAEMVRMLADKTNDPISTLSVTDSGGSLLRSLRDELGDRYSDALEALLDG